MTAEKMTIHRALAELKVINKRITDAAYALDCVKAVKAGEDKIDGKPIKDFNEAAVATYQKIMSLIARRNAIKRAVILSNATTEVTVAGKTYTVAEAIDMKTAIDTQRQVGEIITRQYVAAKTKVAQKSGEAIEEKANDYVNRILESYPRESKTAINDVLIESLRKTYIENNSMRIVDPLDVEARAAAIEEEYENFTTEVDAVLSESNAVTVIEVTY